MNPNIFKEIALIGGGPAALLSLKHILNTNLSLQSIFIFEKDDRLGVGMPYGEKGSCREHVANVSSNELPELAGSFQDYLRRFPSKQFSDFVDAEKLNPYLVIPRLLLGDYLEDQFEKLIDVAIEKGIKVYIHKNTPVKDIIPEVGTNKRFKVKVDDDNVYNVDHVILCTGHVWPVKYEGSINGWYDSPYPPSKFKQATNFPVAVRGTSLTAIDAVKTLARLNGTFKEIDGKMIYELEPSSKNFRLDLFSKGGFLPALRFHSEDDAYSSEWTMTPQEIYEYKKNNEGFVDLNYVFEMNFKLPLQKKDPEFYSSIKNLSIEGFVKKMLSLRERTDSFKLFKAEYEEAEKSIDRKKSITWKEKLAAFSYAMNYPAKHFSAEDMLRLKSTLLPLISIIIASLPQSSYKEMMALHEAGLISLIEVDHESTIEPNLKGGGNYFYKNNEGKAVKKLYQLFVDAIGQQQMNREDFPFKSLICEEMVSPAYLRFRDQEKGLKLYSKKEENVVKSSDNIYYLNVPGLNINDHFQSINSMNQSIEGLYIMAVPFIGGLNPDYSGLDFCDTAAERIIESIANSESMKINVEASNTIEQNHRNIL
jgi:hypothetical protein